MIGGHVPDFYNINGKREVVEILGRAFHDPNFKSPFKKRTLEVEPAISPVDETKLGGLLDRLETLLKQSDGLAVDVAAEVAGIVKGSRFAANFSSISQSVSSYDFDIAGDQVRVLRNSLQA